MLCAEAWPGPRNQKLVPGAPHCAVTTPAGLVCSTSRPWAIAPVALTSTPPRPVCVVTLALEPGTPAFSALLSGAAVLILTTCSRPGLSAVATGEPAEELPPGVSTETSAVPPADDAGTAAIATDPAVGAGDPGAGQTRVAIVTGARVDWAGWPTAAAGCLAPAAP